MEKEKVYYKRLDIIRVVSCIAVFLYHLNILKGGYLAVCTFFVLTGYLSTVSLFRKEKVSILKYYKERFIHIYIPLIIVVFISLLIVTFLTNFVWISMKPETTSVVFGYNNFWQLSANLDYFARHINSPFMHFWYIGILLQFELIFPIIFILFKKLGEKINKHVPVVILTLLALGTCAYFMYSSYNTDLMTVYYSSFTRVFSIVFGVLLGFIHVYYKDTIKKIFKDNTFSKIMFYIYLIVIILLFIFIDSNNKYFNIAMIASTIISCCLIDYGTRANTLKLNVLDRIIKCFAKISYEIYLVQYPVIFMFQDINMNSIIKTILILLITILISIILHYILDFKNVKKNSKIIKIVLLSIVSIFTIFGLIKYITSEDHSKEMKKLEEDLAKNQKLIEEQQQQYLANLKEEENEWEKILNDLDAGEEQLKDTVRKLRVTGVGDSVMELAVRDLYKEFPNGYFDAATNRTEHAVNKILKDLKDKGALGDVIVLNIGTNGGWNNSLHDEMLKIVGDRKIFWLNATNPDYASFNPNLIEFASKHDNVYIIDWISVAKAHPEYLISDKVHPTVKGCKVYASTIYDGIYQVYLKEFNDKKEEKIKEHEKELNKKTSFFGNDILLNLYDYIKEDFKDSKFNINKEYTYNSLKKELVKGIEYKSLTHKLIFVFDNAISLTNDNYKELAELLKDYELYILSIDKKISIDYNNVKIINFDTKDKDYFLVDNIHLTDNGNKNLSSLLKKELIKEGE